MLPRDRYHEVDFIHDERDYSVRLVEEALRRWLTDLEMNFHAADEDHPSLQVLIMERVRELVDDLPPWPGRFPARPVGLTAPTESPATDWTLRAMGTEMYTGDLRKRRDSRSLDGPETAAPGEHLGVRRMLRASIGLRPVRSRLSDQKRHQSRLVLGHLGNGPLKTAATYGVIKGAAVRGIAHTKGFETTGSPSQSVGHQPSRARHRPHQGL